jgi:flagellin-like hook-associated protein FlgL
MIEPTISIGSLLAIVTTIGSGVGFVWAIKTSVKVLDFRLTAQDAMIRAIREDVEKLNEVVTDIGLQQKRMDVIEERVLAQGKRFDEHITRFNRLIDERLRRDS